MDALDALVGRLDSLQVVGGKFLLGLLFLPQLPGQAFAGKGYGLDCYALLCGILGGFANDASLLHALDLGLIDQGLPLGDLPVVDPDRLLQGRAPDKSKSSQGPPLLGVLLCIKIGQLLDQRGALLLLKHQLPKGVPVILQAIGLPLVLLNDRLRRIAAKLDLSQLTLRLQVLLYLLGVVLEPEVHAG